jgi:hypothetical protein
VPDGQVTGTPIPTSNRTRSLAERDAGDAAALDSSPDTPQEPAVDALQWMAEVPLATCPGAFARWRE